MTVHHPIAVVGAGLGGLTLAAVLHRNGLDAAVFDLDASATARDQGGMLDIHVESGQAALRAAGLFAEFQEIIHLGGEAMRVLDRDATVRLEEQDDGNGRRPEVNRRALRDILLAALAAGTVRWGARVTGVEPIGDGRHRVTLADGDTFTTDLLVGADGAWSRVRPLVSAATPVYSGLSFVQAHVLDAVARQPTAAAAVGSGLMFALGDEKGFIAHREPDGRLDIYVALKTPADWATSGAIDFADPEKVKEILLGHFEGWHPSLRSLIADSDGALIPRPIHALPVGHRWDRTPGVTLLGDAAHLMSPFAGEGANLAMLDGAELATAIVAQPGDVETALADYERSLFPRSETAAGESAANLVMLMGPDAPQGLLDMMARYQHQPDRQ